jgi:flavin reductase (DIM6/NTAB) family NADH-FMN oxidoreductase RutF
MQDLDIAVELRTALRRLAKAVVVITAMHDGRRYAMAATAVSELSMDPPSILICVNQSASLHSPLDAGAPFCVNILDAAQRTIAERCSGAIKGEDRFGEGEWELASAGPPMLKGAQAAIVCRNETSVVFGTHRIFIGQVVDIRVGDLADPLVYVDGRYTRCA